MYAPDIEEAPGRSLISSVMMKRLAVTILMMMM
jgi:hypothetical protein